MKPVKARRNLTILSILGATLAVASPFVRAQATDSPHVVYGSDDRQDVSAVTNPLYKKLAQSSAGMIPASTLSTIPGSTRLKITAPTLQLDQNLCPGERFADQLTAAYCSGFLIGSDILVTAGHCIEDASDCARFRWVFDFQQDKLGTPASVDSSNVYSCASILNQELGANTDNDFAVIKLDRPVVGREPLQIRKTGKIELGANLIVIGNPSGIPTKIAGGAKVRSNDEAAFFKANLDTFAGNSGSAVLDATTGVVEGILVRGEDDYIDDAARGCSHVNICTNDGCRGEDVTRITGVTYTVPSPRPSASPTPSPSKVPVISDGELELRSNAMFEAIFTDKTAPVMKVGLFGKNLGYSSGRYKISGAALLGCRMILEKDDVVIASHSGSCKKPQKFMDIIRYYIQQTR